jgi:SAM-dependent methyltransferase
MTDKQLDILDLIIETHTGLERQGPGSAESTREALSFCGDLDDIAKAADLGCGTGSSTIQLAECIAGDIIGVDLIPEFIEILNHNAKKLDLQDKARGIVGNIEDLPFQKEEFDLIWSEGVIDSVGFERGITSWQGFLKKGGYIALTCPSWLTDERPVEIEEFWADAVHGLGTVEQNSSAMQKAGFDLVHTFTIPESCWTDNYFNPRTKAGKVLSGKYPGNKMVEDYLNADKYEVELYAKYKQYYGYVFYIGKKV